MPLLVLLWLALFGVAPSAPSASFAARAVAAVRVDESGRGERAPTDAIRARSVASLAAARPAGHLTPVAPQRHAPFALAASLVGHDPAAAESRRVLARQLSHVVVARGGHLPYFPTAPPLQG